MQSRAITAIVCNGTVGANQLLNDAARRHKEARDLATPTVPGNLKRLGVTFSTRDINYMMDKDLERFAVLKQRDLTRSEAIRLLAVAKSVIKSITRYVS